MKTKGSDLSNHLKNMQNKYTKTSTIAAFPTRKFDAVTMLDVLEHVLGSSVSEEILRLEY